MRIVSEASGRILQMSIQGRLDAFASAELQRSIDGGVQDDTVCVVLDMSGVDYVSSAGLRVLLALFKKLKPRQGAVVLSGVTSYCRNVIDMAGFGDSFRQFESLGQAVGFCRSLCMEKDCLDRWNELETVETDCGSFKIIPGSDDHGAVDVLGDVKDVLYSRVTADHLSSKHFSDTEYSIGLGGLGDRIEDYFPIMGEMITIGGTMVWLPTDGHDTPDFLIPKKDKGQVTLRTGFNTSISGRFNELMMFQSGSESGTTINEFYRALFELAKKRRTDFKGVIGLAVRAQMATVYGSGIKKSPIAEFKPSNGEMVVHPSNIKEWFDMDAMPRHANVTGLICGIGADLTCDLSGYDQEQLNRVFYLNPANVGGKNEMLHNHAVVFNELPMPERTANLDAEVKAVVEQGEFVDMRHLLDSSAVTSAFLGVSYIQSFRKDVGGRGGL